MLELRSGILLLAICHAELNQSVAEAFVAAFARAWVLLVLTLLFYQSLISKHNRLLIVFNFFLLAQTGLATVFAVESWGRQLSESLLFCLILLREEEVDEKTAAFALALDHLQLLQFPLLVVVPLELLFGQLFTPLHLVDGCMSGLPYLLHFS